MNQSGMSIPIPDILDIGSGVRKSFSGHCHKHGFLKIGIIFDSFAEDVVKEDLLEGFSKQAELTTVRIHGDEDIHQLISKAFELNRFDCLAAAGGGAVIDAGKYMAFSRRVPFVSIPTSPSNDGFASSNCSLFVDGKKTTVPAMIPFGVIADLDIIRHAPKEMILAGTGDLMSNITAMHDWYYEESKGIDNVHAFAAMLSKKGVNSFVRTPMEDIQNDVFIKELISSMAMGGISTMISGNSSPISGAEHMISHALDQITEKPLMHGIQVGLASYLMALVHDHRHERLHKVFTRTGFFDYTKTLTLNRDEWERAIILAPDVKPKRKTYLHEEKHRQRAISILREHDVFKAHFGTD
ncbi:iron-containing alcohol dehydrogenase family protein [Salisediminibacterium beveridgei]|uniref:Glycerol-1-phosphate dehydrogenase [NAD(P)+] n=1 Tax=Salisediminibacterium beveridgei TaxID=632773 RepID=A0A1D7QVH2_9BACI|nr:iron-containing alcohol dehydrogenase family protein [Salisediminibacterium beveridgei]AOM83010.1 Glycerol-1-phosphate dehydrogenase [NAD(P)+] [Salisediminibacterium beveridgei]